ncbi:MAG TPA: Rieske 2Fe-2S domain-containing protein [Thermoleophilaceae bacterium]|nr:Rieske 2Fe-2S domain-containing protein [Thermoleophilaceae bacterium]
MADRSGQKSKRKSRYTADRDVAGAFEGETMTRRGLMTGGALAAGGIASAAFGLPALGFAIGPLFEDQEPDQWQDVGPVSDFNTEAYVPRVINIVAEIGEAGKTTIYVRKALPSDKSPSDKPGVEPLPMVAISTRCAHLGCPVRYIQASQRFVCPCHGGVYDSQGAVAGGPPVRPLDRFYNRVRNGRVEIGDRFSLNSKLDRFKPRDPSNHLDGLWQYLYPSRPTT